MGRRAGVTADETRVQLLAAAASVFARRGYEGASIAEITSEAGLSSGAIYAHYGSKAHLFVATIRAYAAEQVAQMLRAGGTNFLEGLAAIGVGLDRPDPRDGALLMEAIVASKRDPEVAALLSEAFAERESLFVEIARQAQEAGVLVDEVDPEALARFTLIIALGALASAALQLPPVDHAGWTTLITALVDRARA